MTSVHAGTGSIGADVPVPCQVLISTNHRLPAIVDFNSVLLAPLASVIARENFSGQRHCCAELIGWGTVAKIIDDIAPVALAIDRN